MWIALGLITLIGSFLYARSLKTQGRWEGERRVLAGGLLYRRLQESYRGQPIRLSFALPCQRGLLLRVKPESSLDDLFKRLGISREFQTGLREVDEEVYIVAEDPRLETLFRSDRKAAVLLLRLATLRTEGARFLELLCVDGQLSIRFKLDRGFQDEALLAQRALPLLQELAQALSAAGDAPETDLSRPFARRAALVLSLNLALVIFGVVHFYRTITFPILPAFIDHGWLWALAFGVALFLPLLYLAWRWLGRSSRAHLVILELVLLGPIGCLLSGHFLAWQVNGLTRFSGPAETHVSSSYQAMFGTRSPPSISFADWRRPGSAVRITISRDLHRNLRLDRWPRPPLELELRRGPLGAYMVHGIRRAPEPEPP